MKFCADKMTIRTKILPVTTGLDYYKRQNKALNFSWVAWSLVRYCMYHGHVFASRIMWKDGKRTVFIHRKCYFYPLLQIFGKLLSFLNLFSLLHSPRVNRMARALRRRTSCSAWIWENPLRPLLMVKQFIVKRRKSYAICFRWREEIDRRHSVAVLHGSTRATSHRAWWIYCIWTAGRFMKSF